MTETTVIASNPYDGERRAGTVGFTLPGVDVRICDMDSGETVAKGEIGIIELKGPNVFRGYWRMPEKLRRSSGRTAIFITGDLGRVDAEGYVHLVGRTKDLVISGGYNVYPMKLRVRSTPWTACWKRGVESATSGFGEESRRSSSPTPHTSPKQACSPPLGERLRQIQDAEAGLHR